MNTSPLLFELRGTATAEDPTVEVRALRIETAGSENDSFGYGYATDPNDFESAVSVGSRFGIGRAISFTEVEENLLVYTDVVPFERMEGISMVDDVDPGMGSLVATCPG